MWIRICIVILLSDVLERFGILSLVLDQILDLEAVIKSAASAAGTLALQADGGRPGLFPGSRSPGFDLPGGCASSRLDHGLKFHVVQGGCASSRLISEFSDCARFGIRSGENWFTVTLLKTASYNGQSKPVYAPKPLHLTIPRQDPQENDYMGKLGAV